MDSEVEQRGGALPQSSDESLPDLGESGFTLVRRLGSGGLGDVYLAQRESTRQQVALKLLRDTSDTSAAWRRARRELRAAQVLASHPHVVVVHELIDIDGIPAIVMEYAERGSLDRVVERSGRLTLPVVLRVALQASSALSAAHRLGIVHRDVKPANLLLTSSGTVKVCDFGIARLVEGEQTSTRTSSISYRYAAPEEFETGEMVGPAADVFALAVSVLHLVTGRIPSLNDRQLFAAGRTGWQLSDSEPVAPRLDQLLVRMLDADPQKRPTMSEVESELLKLCAEAGIEDPAVPRWRPSARDRWASLRSRPVARRGIALALAVVAIGMPLIWLGSRNGTDPPGASVTTETPTSARVVSTTALTTTSSVAGGGVETGKVLFRALDTGASPEARTGNDPAAVADADGALVVYKNFDDLNVYLGECTGDCSDFTSVPLAALGTSAYYPRVAVADGRPVITAVDRGTGGVVMVICSDRLCTDWKRLDFSISAGGAEKVRGLAENPGPTDQNFTSHTDVAIDAAGRPAMVFDDAVTNAITLLRCLDAACERSSSTPVAFGSWPKIAFGSDGLPMIAFNYTSTLLSFAYCTTTDCATFTEVPFKVPGFRPVVTTAGNDVLIAGLDFGANSLSIATCSDLRCSKSETQSFAPDGSFPVFGATSTDKAVFVSWYRELSGIGSVFSCPWGECGKVPKRTDFSDIVSYEALSPGFPATVFGQDSAPVIGNDGRLIIFTWIENTNGKGSALGAVVSAGPPCVDNPFCGRRDA